MNNDFPRITYVQWDVGSHVSFKDTVSKTVWSAITCGMLALQFFLGSPMGFKRNRVSEEDIIKVRELCDRFPIHIFSHYPYVSNLAGSTESLAWNGDATQDSKTSSILKELEYEVNIIGRLGGVENKRSGVVIHPGNYKDRKKGLLTIAQSINKISFEGNAKLLLENSAGSGCSLATTFEEIKEIYDNVVDTKKKYIGVCIDTAHIYGYGLYDLSKEEEIYRLFEDFDKIIGLDKWTLLHLNDSLAPFGSRKDRHAELGQGHIWGNNFKSLLTLLSLCKKHGIPAVLETQPSDMFVLAQLGDENLN